jgi:hypothetical protein
LLRSATVTNSSISLPTSRVVPRTMAPTAASGVAPVAANMSGLRNASISPISFWWSKLASGRAMVSVSIE